MPPVRSILIALPTTQHSMKVETGIAVARTVQALSANGIAVDLHNIDSAEIVTARDMFANMLLHSSHWDALLFVDSDMGFEPQLILRMLAQDTEITAAACPRRSLNLVNFVLAAQKTGNIDQARSHASEFTIFFDWDHQRKAPTEVRDGFCSAAAAGMAIALISKSALQTMVARKVVKPRQDLQASGGETCWSFFGNLDNKGHRLGEDYSFCYRWTKLLKRDIRVCVDEEITHAGDFQYKGRYSDLLA